MYREWPFFRSTLDLVEMILAKADMRIAATYDAHLVNDPEVRHCVNSAAGPQGVMVQTDLTLWSKAA